MSKPIRVLIGVVVVLALAGGGLAYLRLQRPAVTATLVLFGDIDIREVQPAFNDSDHIATMTVQEGASVKRGQLIATLEDTRYAAMLAQAQAQMHAAQQALARLLAGSRPEEIAQARANMQALEVTYRNNEVAARRYAALAPHGGVTRQQSDDAQAAFEAAHQQYEAAREAYLLVVAGPRAEDIAAGRANFEAAQAAVALAQRQFDDTSLYAPSDGVVENRILEPGDIATPSTPVYTIALPNPLWVRAYVPESDLARVRLGTLARVSTDSFPGRVYQGWIGYLSPTAEFTPKTVETPELRTALVYQLRVYVCDARGELRLGMPATVTIDTDWAAPVPAPPGCGPDDAGQR